MEIAGPILRVTSPTSTNPNCQKVPILHGILDFFISGSILRILESSCREGGGQKRRSLKNKEEREQQSEMVSRWLSKNQSWSQGNKMDFKKFLLL